MESIIALAAQGIAAAGAVTAAWVAARVHKQTKPISNGFAPGVVRRLDRIESLITDHIKAHADSDVRRKKD
jgi:predicted TIM-barrel enzyme